MQRVLLSVLVATVASLMGLRIASAQDNDNRRDPGPRNRPAAAEARAKLMETLFKRLDADKDGNLSLEEFKGILSLAKTGANKGEPLSKEGDAKPGDQPDETPSLDDSQAAKLLAKMLGGGKGEKGRKDADVDKLFAKAMRGPKGEGGRGDVDVDKLFAKAMKGPKGEGGRKGGRKSQ